MAKARTYRVMRRADQSYEIEAVDRVDGVDVVEVILINIDGVDAPLSYTDQRDAVDEAVRLRLAEHEALNPLPEGEVWSSRGDAIDQAERRARIARQQDGLPVEP